MTEATWNLEAFRRTRRYVPDLRIFHEEAFEDRTGPVPGFSYCGDTIWIEDGKHGFWTLSGCDDVLTLDLSEAESWIWDAWASTERSFLPENVRIVKSPYQLRKEAWEASQR